ncbi:MAG: amino acid permease [Gammaproteobacteria bacterium]|nr:amino acid permease [Gammaproteobacteria bacterium]
MKNNGQKKVLSTLALTMISIAGIVNLRNLPIMAGVGFSALFFYILAALFFLLPSAFVCAELASLFPEAGGLYLWVEKAFGAKAGFFAIWSEWFNNVIGVPATLSFIAAAVAYSFIPHLSHHKVAMFLVMLVILWGSTLFNFLGIKASSRLNIIGALFGSILPTLIITILGFVWIYSGHIAQISFSWHALVPKWHFANVAFFIGVLSGYSGMQITAFHIQNVKNPKYTFPRAIFFATILILAITIFGSLAIGLVVPSQKLSLVSGVMDGFLGFFTAFHMTWALYILAGLIAISGISTLSAWLLAPARGLSVAARDGHFPRWCAHENSRGMPTNILVLQALIGTALASLFLFIPSLSEAFWLLVVLTSQFTLVMYLLVFSAAIKLRYKYSKRPNLFCMPGGNLGLWVIAGSSIIVCSLGVILGYVPPKNLHIHKVFDYEFIVLSGNLLYVLLPLLIYRKRS